MHAMGYLENQKQTLYARSLEIERWPGVGFIFVHFHPEPWGFFQFDEHIFQMGGKNHELSM